jgi:hypothetical protein
MNEATKRGGSMVKLHWSESPDRYGSGEHGKIGKWTVFEWIWNSCRSRDDEETGPYALLCRLPGIKPRFGNFHTVEECYEKAERIMTYWLDSARLKVLD